MTLKTINMKPEMKLSNNHSVSIITVLALSLSLLTAGLFQSSFATEAEAKTTPEPQAMPVEVTTITQQSIRLWKEFSGRLTPVDYVDVRPQATGLITEVKFVDGQFVNKGDTLYIIDPRPLKAIVDQKKADYIAAKNSYSFAKKESQRAIDLMKKKMVPQQLVDDRMNTELAANSTVNHAKAELVEAEINLSYAYIKAPISGMISRTELTEGNLVMAGANAPLLTSIVDNKRIYADFEVDEQTYLRYTQSESADIQSNPVELRLQNGEQVYQGSIHAFDNKIDPASGTIRARAIFDNPKGQLLSGMFARLKLGGNSKESTILVSELAIGTDQNRKFVYVVDENNMTTYRQVKLGNSINGSRIILSGLSIGDKVIVKGLMRIQPNMLVAPTESSKAL